KPKAVTSLPLPDFAYGLTSQPGWLAIAMGKNGMAFYSLSNPAAPVLVYNWYGTIWDVASAKNVLYLAADPQGLQVFDVNNPRSPVAGTQISLGSGSELPGSRYPAGVAVTVDPRGIVWVCAGDGALYGLDVRNVLRPRHVAMLGIGGCAATNVAGSRLYVA